MNIENADTHPRLTELVYEMLREDILSRKLVEGDRLLLNVIAKNKGVSITPVREALVRLEKEGFVNTVRRGGSFVREISLKEIKDTYEVREVIEKLGVHLATMNFNETILNELNESCALYEKGLREKQMNICIDNDINFHYLIAKASGNDKIISILQEMLFRIALMISRGSDYWTRAEGSLLDHYAIIDAMRKKDSITAEEIVFSHVRRGKEYLFKLKQQSAS